MQEWRDIERVISDTILSDADKAALLPRMKSFYEFLYSPAKLVVNVPALSGIDLDALTEAITSAFHSFSNDFNSRLIRERMDRELDALGID